MKLSKTKVPTGLLIPDNSLSSRGDTIRRSEKINHATVTRNAGSRPITVDNAG